MEIRIFELKLIAKKFVKGPQDTANNLSMIKNVKGRLGYSPSLEYVCCATYQR